MMITRVSRMINLGLSPQAPSMVTLIGLEILSLQEDFVAAVEDHLKAAKLVLTSLTPT